MATGILRIQAFAARQSAPVDGVTVNIVGDGFTAARMTDAEGNAADVTLTAPPSHWRRTIPPVCPMRCAA